MEILSTTTLPRLMLFRNTRKCWPPKRGWKGLLRDFLAPRPAALALLGIGIVSLATAADDLDRLRDHQDRAGLDARAAALHAAAAKTPNDANAWYRAAIAYSFSAEVAMEQRDKNAAERAAEAGAADAEKAIDLNGKNADYYRVLGTLCGQIIPANPIIGALSYGKRAKEALDKAVEMDPKSPRAYVARGVGNYYMPASFGGGPDAAIRDFKKAISLDPNSADAYLWMGIALKKQHQNAQAREALAKSLQLAPDRLWTKDQLEKTPPQ